MNTNLTKFLKGISMSIAAIGLFAASSASAAELTVYVFFHLVNFGRSTTNSNKVDFSVGRQKQLTTTKVESGIQQTSMSRDCSLVIALLLNCAGSIF